MKKKFLIKKGKPCEVSVLEEKGKIIAYTEGADDYYMRKVSNADAFFDTAQEAETWLSKNAPSDDEINKVVRYLSCLEDDDRRKIADRLNADYTVRKLYLGLLDDYKDEEEIPYQIEEAAALALKGCMNIDARTIRISEVASISWGDGTKFWEEYSPCELHLKDGSMIKPRTIYDYWIIRILFGRNDSGRVFSNIKFEEGE